jgi:two-component sensor histidine kinase
MNNKRLTGLPVAGPSSTDNSNPPGALEVARFICHRCRNDLTTIRDLLSLRAAYASDPETLAKSMEGRIAALSMAYNHSASPHGKELTLNNLARDIVDRIFYHQSNNQRFDISLPLVRVNLRLASPIGLWLYEIISNALIHGAGAALPGVISITGQEAGGNLLLSIRDQGPGLPQGFNLEKDAKAGLRVAQAVASFDLKAKMEFSQASPGLCTKLEVPLDEIERLNRM